MEQELTLNCIVSQAKSKDEMAWAFGLEEFYKEVKIRDGEGVEELEMDKHH
jgi:hypothetical protein